MFKWLETVASYVLYIKYMKFLLPQLFLLYSRPRNAHWVNKATSRCLHLISVRGFPLVVDGVNIMMTWRSKFL